MGSTSSLVKILPQQGLESWAGTHLNVGTTQSSLDAAMYQPCFLSSSWVKWILGTNDTFILSVLMEKKTSQLFSYYSHLQKHPPSQVPNPLKTGCTQLGVYVMMNFLGL